MVVNIVIQYTAKAMRLTINDSGKKFVLQVEKSKNSPT